MTDIKDRLIEQVEHIVKELEEGTEDPLTYLEDALDIEVKSSMSDGKYRGAEVLVAAGGPTVWIDTQRNRVVGKWGFEKIERHYYDQIGLDDAVEEYYQCVMQH
jgi:hypothetical protein